MPPEAMTGMRDGLRQLDRRLDIDALHHAVAGDVGVDDRRHAVGFEALRQIDDVVPGDLGPAVGGDQAVFGVEPDDDRAREMPRRPRPQMRVLHRLGADDDVVHAHVDIGLDGFHVADAAADLDRHVRKRRADRLNGGPIHRLAGNRTVQVHHMQAPRAGLHPAPRHRHRIVGKDRAVVHAPLAQAHALAVLQIDCGND